MRLRKRREVETKEEINCARPSVWGFLYVAWAGSRDKLPQEKGEEEEEMLLNRKAPRLGLILTVAALCTLLMSTPVLVTKELLPFHLGKWIIVILFVSVATWASIRTLRISHNVLKPELTTLEACHRLAPIEGQKEIARRLKAVQKEERGMRK